MKNFVKIILPVFLCFLSFSLSGQTFGEADLERLIMNHPMMKNYDAKTGHFKNTPYELKNVADLKSENASMSSEIKEIESKELNNSMAAISSEIEDEDAFWDNVVSLGVRKYQLKYKIQKNENMIISDGKPGSEKLYPIIDNICNDIFVPMYDKNKVILNKQPRYLTKKPELNGKDLHAFWFRPDEKVLCDYLQYSSFIGLMFPSVDKTILFQKTSGDTK